MARETEDKFVVHMPLGLRDQLKQKATRNHRPTDSEIVYRLKHSGELEGKFTQANQMVDELFARNQHLQTELAAVSTP